MDLSRRTFFGLTALALTYTTAGAMRGDEPLAIDADAGELVFVGATREPVPSSSEPPSLRRSG